MLTLDLTGYEFYIYKSISAVNSYISIEPGEYIILSTCGSSSYYLIADQGPLVLPIDAYPIMKFQTSTAYDLKAVGISSSNALQCSIYKKIS